MRAHRRHRKQERRDKHEVGQGTVLNITFEANAIHNI